MNKIIIISISLTLILIVVGFLVFNNFKNDSSKNIPTNTSLYQGPVQEGYDEQLFRETGRYEKESEK